MPAHLGLPLLTGALLVVAFAGLPPQACAQDVGGPGASRLWHKPTAERTALPTEVIPRGISEQERGLVIGAVIGGVAAGFLGNRVCRAYAATGGCTGQTLWWGTAGAILGGLIGATSAGDRPARSESPSENTSPTDRRGGA